MAEFDSGLGDPTFQPQVRPPYVEFGREAHEDRNASISAHKTVMKDVDMVYVTPIGTRDRLVKSVGEWFEELESKTKAGRIPPTWIPQYRGAYEAWQKGQDIPLLGTPIRGWSILSPAQQENIVKANIRTVEDLAQANEEALGRIGMGAAGLKEKASTWIKAQTGPAKLAAENAALKAEIQNLKVRNESLEERFKKLEASLNKEPA